MSQSISITKALDKIVSMGGLADAQDYQEFEEAIREIVNHEVRKAKAEIYRAMSTEGGPQP